MHTHACWTSKIYGFTNGNRYRIYVQISKMVTYVVVSDECERSYKLNHVVLRLNKRMHAQNSAHNSTKLVC